MNRYKREMFAMELQAAAKEARKQKNANKLADETAAIAKAALGDDKPVMLKTAALLKITENEIKLLESAGAGYELIKLAENFKAAVSAAITAMTTNRIKEIQKQEPKKTDMDLFKAYIFENPVRESYTKARDKFIKAAQKGVKNETNH